MAVRIEPRDDGNWKIFFDNALPSVLRIEDGELKALFDALVEHYVENPPQPYEQYYKELAELKEQKRLIELGD